MLEVEIISHKGLENLTPIGITSFKFSHAYDSIKHQLKILKVYVWEKSLL
jgi:hypothetical protein